MINVPGGQVLCFIGAPRDVIEALKLYSATVAQQAPQFFDIASEHGQNGEAFVSKDGVRQADVQLLEPHEGYEKEPEAPQIEAHADEHYVNQDEVPRQAAVRLLEPHDVYEKEPETPRIEATDDVNRANLDEAERRTDEQLQELHDKVHGKVLDFDFQQAGSFPAVFVDGTEHFDHFAHAPPLPDVPATELPRPPELGGHVAGEADYINTAKFGASDGDIFPSDHSPNDATTQDGMDDDRSFTSASATPGSAPRVSGNAPAIDLDPRDLRTTLSEIEKCGIEEPGAANHALLSPNVERPVFFEMVDSDEGLSPGVCPSGLAGDRGGEDVDPDPGGDVPQHVAVAAAPSATCGQAVASTAAVFDAVFKFFDVDSDGVISRQDADRLFTGAECADRRLFLDRLGIHCDSGMTNLIRKAIDSFDGNLAQEAFMALMAGQSGAPSTLIEVAAV